MYLTVFVILYVICFILHLTFIGLTIQYKDPKFYNYNIMLIILLIGLIPIINYHILYIIYVNIKLTK